MLTLERKMITDVKGVDMENPLSVEAVGGTMKEQVDSNNNGSDGNRGSGDSAGDSGGQCPTVAGTSGGKYQLRPRSLQSRRRSESEWSFQDTLRHKPRPPPLSRYRRKTANARERYRMRQINTAFESLRGVLPSWVCSRRTASDMTKITTLKLASAYIRSLQDILDGKAHQDTCSWVLSSILGDTSSCKEPQSSQYLSSPSKVQQPPAHVTHQESDFVSFLYGSSSDVGAFQENLDTFSYLSPMSETEAVALLLGSDPSRNWSEGQHPPLVT
ncbi:uncharacterized protein [Panulirus ornatus]|uniref:uncharacterized protein n=1 Tax=Panulirus ornatus TaxID=150431 RepID=UPI003A8631EA